MGLPRGRAAEVNVAGKRLPQYSEASACGTGAGSKDLGEPRKMALREMVALVSRLRAVIEPCEHAFKESSCALRTGVRPSVTYTSVSGTHVLFSRRASSPASVRW